MNKNLGLVVDMHPDEANPGQWRRARNVVLDKKRGTVANEPGATPFGVSDNTGYINGIIPTDEGHIEFNTNDTTVNRIIRVLHDGTSTVVINDSVLGLRKANPIRGVAQRNYAGDLVVAWWEGNADSANRPRILNFDCLPFELDGSKAFVNDADVDLLRLFPPVNYAGTRLLEVLNGGNLQNAAYYVYIAYEFGDKSRTSWFNGSNAIMVYDENTKQSFTRIQGGVGGESASKSIKVRFTNLDTRYPKLAVAIVRKANSVVSATHATSLTITDTSMDWVYTGNQLISDLAIAEVIVPNQTYDRIHTGTITDGRLTVANMRTEAAPDIQKYA